MSSIICAVISFVCGFVIGYFVFKLICITIADGDLRVDNSDESTNLFLELKNDISDVVKKKFVVLKVKVKDFLPHD